MRLRRLVVRGFRNLADLEVELPPAGLILLGANAQGKTNLLEAIYYPVLFRSFKGTADAEVARCGGPGFHLDARPAGGGSPERVLTSYVAGARRKRITVNGEEIVRVADAVGRWLAVVFLPTDVGLASGPASGRRQYLDRLLSLADPCYLRALTRYRAALAQRNSGLRAGRVDVARAFDRAVAAAGADIVRARQRWAASAAEQFDAECEALAEPGEGRLRYEGRADLADPRAWPAALEEALPRDRARGLTSVGPHRDDLVMEVGGRPIREYGSTGQQRSAAVALKLIEIECLREARGTDPALLLDDVFAELDRERQQRLSRRLLGPAERQVFITAPRRDELPPSFELPVWEMEEGRIGAPRRGKTADG